MPLNPTGLESDLADLFEAPPSSIAECAQSWADAVESYASSIVPPSTAVTTAAAALSSALAAAFATPAAAPGMDAAFAAFAVAVGAGMAGYAPVPPVLPLGVALQVLPPYPETHADAAEAWADLIHAWMTTGVSTLIAPPNTVVPWS